MGHVDKHDLAIYQSDLCIVSWGQVQLGKSGKLATFACYKRISENPN